MKGLSAVGVNLSSTFFCLIVLYCSLCSCWSPIFLSKFTSSSKISKVPSLKHCLEAFPETDCMQNVLAWLRRQTWIRNCISLRQISGGIEASNQSVNVRQNPAPSCRQIDKTVRRQHVPYYPIGSSYGFAVSLLRSGTRADSLLKRDVLCRETGELEILH